MPSSASGKRSRPKTAIATISTAPQRSPILFSWKGIEFPLPQKQRVVRLRPLGALALLVLPCAVAGRLILPHTGEISAALATSAAGSVKIVQQSATLASNWASRLYAVYRAPVIQRGVIYDDALENNWVLKVAPHQSAVTLKAASKAVAPYRGGRAIRVRVAQDLDGLRLKVPPARGINLSDYSRLKLAVNGGAIGNQHLFLRTEIDGKARKTVALSTPKARKWSMVRLPLSKIAATRGRLTGVTIFASSPQPAFFVDDLRLE